MHDSVQRHVEAVIVSSSLPSVASFNGWLGERELAPMSSVSYRLPKIIIHGRAFAIAGDAF